MFRLNRNERSHWSGNGVHVEPESVFMIGRNMQFDDVKSDTLNLGNDSNLLIVFYVQIMPDDFVMQLHRF